MAKESLATKSKRKSAHWRLPPELLQRLDAVAGKLDMETTGFVEFTLERFTEQAAVQIAQERLEAAEQFLKEIRKPKA